MDIPQPHRGSRALAPPEIYVHESASYRNSSRSSSYNSSSSTTSAIPMSIPNSREPVPPPLPPPKDLADIKSNGRNGPDLAWSFANQRNDVGSFGSSVDPGSSLHGGSFVNKRDGRPEYTRGTSSSSTIKTRGDQDQAYPRDEGYSSLSTINNNDGSYRSVFILCFSLCSRARQSLSAQLPNDPSLMLLHPSWLTINYPGPTQTHYQQDPSPAPFTIRFKRIPKVTTSPCC